MPSAPLQSLISLDADLLQRLFDEIDACIYIKDREARYRVVNAALLKQFGLTREQVLGFTDHELAGTEQIPERIEEQRQVLENGAVLDREVGQLLRISSDQYTFRCIEKPLRGSNGEILGLYGVATDITELKRLQSSHREQHDLLQALLENTDSNVFLTDANNRVHYANRKVLDRLDVTEEELIGKRLDDLISPELLEQHQQQYQEAIAQQGPITGVNQFTDNHGQVEFYWYVKQPLQWKNQSMVMGMSTEITDLYRLKEKLLTEASTDALTGLMNRRYFFQQAEREFARAQRHQLPLSMLVMDIDHFKQVNDQYGHPAGDQVLSEIARCLSDQVRQEDLLGRIGGEEFALLLIDTNLEAALQLAERIRSRVAALQISVEEQLIRPTLSLGAALLAPQDETLDALYQRSDQALYQAKESGRNRVCSNNAA